MSPSPQQQHTASGPLDMRSLSVDDDPLDSYTQVTGSGDADLHASLASLRAEHGPVVAGTDGLFGDAFWYPVSFFGLAPGSSAYLLLTFDGVAQVARSSAASNRIFAASIEKGFGRTMTVLDDPEHQQHRALVQHALTRNAVLEWGDTVVAPTAQRVIDSFAADGNADLVARFAKFTFPVFATLFGLSEHDLPRFYRWASELIAIGLDERRGLRARQEFDDYLRPLITQQRQTPGDNLMGLLVRAELDGDRLSDDQILDNLRFLCVAGMETSYRATSTMLAALLSHPKQLDDVRNDPGLIPQAIEEVLRWDGPGVLSPRLITTEIVVEGTTIAAGSIALLSWAAANRDPSRWENPHDFDIHRDAKPHIAFAQGAHTCLGMNFARMELSIGLRQLLERLPAMRLDPNLDPPKVQGAHLRSPAAVHAIWDVSRPTGDRPAARDLPE